MMFNTAESVLIVEAGNTGKFSKLLYNMIGKNGDTYMCPQMYTSKSHLISRNAEEVRIVTGRF